MLVSPAPAQSSPRRPFWRSPHSLLYLVALVFLAIVLWRSRFWDSGDALRHVDAAYFVLVPLLSLLLAVPLAVRARAILSAIGFHASAPALAPITYFGNTVGFVTPAASGELLRPSLLRRIFGLPTAQAIGVVLFERSFSFYLIGLSCLFALSWTAGVPNWAGPVALPLLGIACLAPSALVAAAPALNDRLPVARFVNLVPHRVREHVRDSASTLSALWLNAGVVAIFIALTVVMFLVMAIQFWLIPEALGQDISIQEAWVVVTASAMAGFLSGLPLGLGAADAVMLSLLKAYGVETTEAGQIVILTRVMINLPTGLFGLGAYLIAVRQKPTAASSPPLARFAVCLRSDAE